MRQFYDWQTAGGGDDVSRLVATLERAEIAWCMIGGLAVNHWAREPLATADVDVVIAAGQVDAAVKALRQEGFTAKKFAWSVNLNGGGLSRFSQSLGAGRHPRNPDARGQSGGHVARETAGLSRPATPREQAAKRPVGHPAAGRGASEAPQAAARWRGEKTGGIKAAESPLPLRDTVAAVVFSVQQKNQEQ